MDVRDGRSSTAAGPEDYDVIIVGAGIVGAMTARFLSKYHLRVLVLEREVDVGMSPSSANSAIIHAGYDPEPGSLKALMNVQGNRMWEDLAGELHIPFLKTGSYVVAFGDDEFARLQGLYERGVANGVPRMRVLRRDEFRRREPLIHPEVSGALWTPTGAVVDPFMAVLAALENAVSNGARLLLETVFEDFVMEGSTIKGVRTSRGIFTCRWVINCAGLTSDEVMHRAGVRPEFCITPRRGEYLIFDATQVMLNNVLFRVPSEKGKGVIVSTTTHGNVMIGPNATVVDRTDTATTEAGLREVFEQAKRMVPSLNVRDTIAQYAGIRATGNADKDFVIEVPREVNGLVNIAGIESPGFVSAPAIAMRVIDLLREAGETLTVRSTWTPIRMAPLAFSKLSHREKAEAVRQNPAYGRIVCRCEEVTEGEIVDAIHSAVPAHTYDGIKRRTWLGTGRCQGGFDYPRVMEILAQELGVPMTAVTKKGKGSELVCRATKDVPDEVPC